MSVTHHLIEIAGEPVGHAISLGTRYAFYTAHPQLKHFDARRFDSLEGIRDAVAVGLTARNASKQLWRPKRLLTEEEITDLMSDNTFDDDPRSVRNR